MCIRDRHLDVAALIALGGQRIGFLAAELLQVAHGQALAELLDLDVYKRQPSTA